MAMNLMRFNPFSDLDALRKQFMGDDFLTSLRGASLPTTDVYTQEDKQLVVEAHLPNFDESDINVDIEGGALVVQAEKHEKEEDKKKKYMVRESSISFYRRIPLPDEADQNEIDAHFTDGVLKIVVPFKDVPAPKRIMVRTGNQPQQQVGASQPDEPTLPVE